MSNTIFMLSFEGYPGCYQTLSKDTRRVATSPGNTGIPVRLTDRSLLTIFPNEKGCLTTVTNPENKFQRVLDLFAEAGIDVSKLPSRPLVKCVTFPLTIEGYENKTFSAQATQELVCVTQVGPHTDLIQWTGCQCQQTRCEWDPTKSMILHFADGCPFACEIKKMVDIQGMLNF